MSNVSDLNRERANRIVAAERSSPEVRLERLRKTLLGLIEEHADLPRHELIGEFSGCLVVIEAGAYGWRK
jgi:septum formation topological specificity factor MinE